MAQIVYVGGLGDGRNGDDLTPVLTVSAIVADETAVEAMHDRVQKLARHHGDIIFGVPGDALRAWDDNGRPVAGSAEKITELVTDLVDAIRDSSVRVRRTVLGTLPPAGTMAAERDALYWDRDAPLWEQALARTLSSADGSGGPRRVLVMDDRHRHRLANVTRARDVPLIAEGGNWRTPLRSFVGSVHYVDGRADAGVLLADVAAFVESRWGPQPQLNLVEPMDRLVRQWQNTLMNIR